MRFKRVGNKRDNVIIVVKNAEASATITAKTPVCFVMNGTDDGLGVVTPNTSTVAGGTSAFAGIVLEAIAAGKYGESMVFGFVEDAVIFRAARTASTNSWTSSASIANFTPLNVDTVNNALSSFATVVAATGYLPFAFLCESIDSFAASASATSDTRTAMTVAANVFVRNM